MRTRRPITLVSALLVELPTAGDRVATRDAVVLLERAVPFFFFFFFPSRFLFQLLLLIQKLESSPGQKADLAAGVTHVRREAGWDCS